MKPDAPQGRGSAKEFALFVAKLLGMLALIFAFGLVIFWARRAIG